MRWRGVWHENLAELRRHADKWCSGMYSNSCDGSTIYVSGASLFAGRIKVYWRAFAQIYWPDDIFLVDGEPALLDCPSSRQLLDHRRASPFWPMDLESLGPPWGLLPGRLAGAFRVIRTASLRGFYIAFARWCAEVRGACDSPQEQTRHYCGRQAHYDVATRTYSTLRGPGCAGRWQSKAPAQSTLAAGRSPSSGGAAKGDLNQRRVRRRRAVCVSPGAGVSAHGSSQSYQRCGGLGRRCAKTPPALVEWALSQSTTPGADPRDRACMASRSGHALGELSNSGVRRRLT